MLVLVGVLLVVVSPVGALAAGIYFGVALLLFNRVIQRRTRQVARERDQVQARWLALLQQALGGLREIRLRQAESEFAGLFDEVRQRQNKHERSLIFGAEFGRYYLEATFIVGFGVLASTVLLTQGANTVPVLGLMLAAGFRLLPSAGRLLHAFSLMRQGEGSLSVILDELDSMGEPNLNDVPLPTDLPTESTMTPDRPAKPMAVSIQDISYSYPNSSRPTISHLSAELSPGQALGIVGPSGSGKTTTVDLLCGLLTPTTGRILIDGHPTTGPDRSWQRRIAYVPQEVFLIDGTIERNIVFGTGKVDGKSLTRAVRLAQLDEWLASLPLGLQTPTGERGTLVSGGQRQRIGIARALYRNPSVLILDEATAALDVETESYLTSAIGQLAGDLTLVIIAHRLSTIRNCDQILVLSDGEVVGSGTYADLSASNDLFSRWVDLAGLSAR
jgi:ABC-type multidrug transport system fused ATPase/permease subunit